MAAGQDFAHNEAPSQIPASAGGITSILPVVGIIFIAAACFSGGYWIGANDIKQTGNKTDIDAIAAQLAVKKAEAIMQQVQIESLQQLVEQWKNKAGQEAHTKVGELSFYKDLPQQSVMPAPVSAKVIKKKPAKTSPPSKPISAASVALDSSASTSNIPDSIAPASNKALSQVAYHIQIASFRHRADAMPIQKKLSTVGFPAFIRQVDLGAKGQWFRVYAGPFTSKPVAENRMQQIEQQLKIKGFLVRAR